MVAVTQAQWACCCSMEAWIYLRSIDCNHNCHHNHSPFQTSPWQKSTCYTLPWQQDLVTPDHMLHIATVTRSCDQSPHATYCHGNKILWPQTTCYTLPWQQDLVTTDHRLHTAMATRSCDHRPLATHCHGNKILWNCPECKSKAMPHIIAWLWVATGNALGTSTTCSNSCGATAANKSTDKSRCAKKWWRQLIQRPTNF